MIPFDRSKFDYTEKEALEAAATGRLLSAEIEFNRRCNYRCPYCYAAGEYEGRMLTAECAESVIRQAAELGARKIVVLGGEPLLCRELESRIRLITGLGMGAEIFTNGALMTEELAKFFYEHGCRVVVKLNTLRADVQEKLTGVPHALDKALRAIDLLQKAGFDERMLAASSVICSENESEVVELWKHLRRHRIKPYLEIMTPQGRLLENRQLLVDPRRLREIFYTIAEYDRAHGYEWEPQPPLVGAKCLRHQHSCVINAGGDVTPCVGVTVTIGNVYERKLADILMNSRVMRNLKDFRRMIKGPCRSCEKAESCYGCRGAAYQLTGDYLASDPLCWKNSGELLDRPPSLPTDAQQWLPHRPPITMIERLVEFGEWSVAEAEITPDNRFLRDGVLDAEAIPELVAQTCAVINGFEEENHHIEGMLTGMRDVEFLVPIRRGDKLRIEVRESARIDNYHTLDFRVYRAERELCVRGELSICRID